jgi:hypothetical protein
MPSEEPEMGDDEVPAEEPSPEEDLGEMDAMDALDAFVNTPVDMVGDNPEEMGEIDLSSYADIDETSYIDEENKEVEIDLDEIKNSINSAIGETLSKYFK